MPTAILPASQTQVHRNRSEGVIDRIPSSKKSRLDYALTLQSELRFPGMTGVLYGRQQVTRGRLRASVAEPLRTPLRSAQSVVPPATDPCTGATGAHGRKERAGSRGALWGTPTPHRTPIAYSREPAAIRTSNPPKQLLRFTLDDVGYVMYITWRDMSGSCRGSRLAPDGLRGRVEDADGA